jgi:uncharacterized protein YgiM (DUF1202 family)
VFSSFASPVYIAAAEVSLHQYQNSTSTVLLKIPKGAKVKVMDSSYGSWWQVRYRERTGFAQSNQLKYSKENDRLDYDPIVNSSNLYSSSPSITLPARLPLYEHPKTSSAILTNLSPGTKVKVVENKNSTWTMVHVQGRTGYLQKVKLNARPTATSASSSTSASTSAPAKETVRSSSGRRGTHTLTKATSLRKEPDGKASVLLRFAPGDQVEVIDDSGEWWWEATFKGKRGWVKRRLLEKN